MSLNTFFVMELPFGLSDDDWHAFALTHFAYYLPTADFFDSEKEKGRSIS